MSGAPAITPTAVIAADFVQIDSSFAPPLWLRNAHVQSVAHSMAWWRRRVRGRARALLTAAEAVIVECDAGVRLSGWCSRQPASTTHNQPHNQSWVVILHGWLGSADSNQVVSLSALLFAAGYNVFRLNLRDHGNTHHLNVGLFHSCLLDEVVSAIRTVQHKYDARDLSLAGFSLGGNFALRIAALAPQSNIELRRVVTISPALNPQATDAALACAPPLYRHYFLRKWKQALRLKQRSFPGHYDFTELLQSRTVTELTTKLVHAHSNFASLADYYQGYSLLGDRLQSLQVPTHIIMALDDPIIPAADIARLPLNGALQVLLTTHGGHCGFFARLLDERWIDRKALSLLDS